MAFKTWKVTKVRYCSHVGQEVAMEVEAVYPSDFIPDSAPRIQAHRCSNAVNCLISQRAACKWSGANPNYDPYAEKDEE